MRKSYLLSEETVSVHTEHKNKRTIISARNVCFLYSEEITCDVTKLESFMYMTCNKENGEIILKMGRTPTWVIRLGTGLHMKHTTPDT